MSMNHKISDMDLINKLSSNSGFIQGLIDYNGEPIKLEDYQGIQLDSRDKFTIWAKSRQIGWSFGSSLKAFARAMLSIKPYRATILSKDQAEANDKISYIKAFWYGMNPDWREGTGKRLFINNVASIGWEDERKFTYEIRSYASRPVRGPSSDVFFDEAAHCMYASEILMSCLPIVSRGNWLLNIGSTPNGIGDTFSDIFLNSASFRKIMIKWWDCSALCRDVKDARVNARLMGLEERVSRYGTESLIEQYRILSEDYFRQEYECDFLSIGDSFLSKEIIEKCIYKPYIDYDDDRDVRYLGKVKESDIVRKYGGVEFKLYNVGMDTNATVRSLAKGCMEGRVGHLICGLDLGSRVNIGSLIFIEEIGKLQVVRAILHFEKWEMARVIEFIDWVMEVLPVNGLAFDETGIGIPFSEAMRGKRYRYKCYPIHFSGTENKTAIKEIMAINLKIRMEECLLGIPDFGDFVSQLKSVKRSKTATGRVKLDAPVIGGKHGDDFWALALGSYIGAKATRNIAELPVIGEQKRIFPGNEKRAMSSLPSVSRQTSIHNVVLDIGKYKG